MECVSHQASFKGYTCPNCGLEYSLEFGNQESVNEFAKKYWYDDLNREKNKYQGKVEK